MRIAACVAGAIGQRADGGRGGRDADDSASDAPGGGAGRTVAVENEVRGLMPAVVVRFLTGIVSGDDTIRTIALSPAELSPDRCVQEVACEGGHGVTTRRVFGFAPMRVRLDVSRSGGRPSIRLAT